MNTDPLGVERFEILVCRCVKGNENRQRLTQTQPARSLPLRLAIFEQLLLPARLKPATEIIDLAKQSCLY